MSKLFVQNFPFETTEAQLQAYFEELIGPVASCKIIFDRETGKSRGFGYVEMAEADARSAIKNLHDRDFSPQEGIPARPLRVLEAREREDPREPRNRADWRSQAPHGGRDGYGRRR